MKIVYATATASVGTGGRPVTVNLGSHWRADDPLVVQYPSLFSDDPRYGLCATVPFIDEAAVEQATAAPGELRRVGRRGE